MKNKVVITIDQEKATLVKLRSLKSGTSVEPGNILMEVWSPLPKEFRRFHCSKYCEQK